MSTSASSWVMSASTPTKAMLAPTVARRGSGSRSSTAPITMMSAGVSELRIAPLVALVYCSPQYCSTLWIPPPSRPRTTMGFQCRRSSARCRQRRGPTTGAISSSAITQRQNVSATGGTSR